MGCLPSKEAGPDQEGQPQAVQASNKAAEDRPGPNGAGKAANAVDASAVELEDAQEARDSVGQLPSSLHGSASDLASGSGTAQRGARVQFGGVDVQNYEVPPPPVEEHSHFLLQKSLPQVAASNVELETRAAGLKHIGFGPLKKENQDEYFCQVGGFGGEKDGCCYCIFDGHGNYGRDAAHFCRQELPVLFDAELRKYYARAAAEGVKDPNAKELIEPILSDAFVETERRLHTAGVNVSSSGTTASVVFQNRSSVWVGAAGDSRVLCLAQIDNAWKVQPLTLDHRPSRKTEKFRVEAAGGRVEPKRLPSGKTVGEPRLWLANLPSPGLLLSRSIGDDMATSVGCTARPEITFMALRPYLDQYLIIASDGVWDVLSNDTVSQLVTDAGEPEAGCQAVLEAALLEWEERLAADNISIIVVQLQWGDIMASNSSAAMAVVRSATAGSSFQTKAQAPQQQAAGTAGSAGGAGGQAEAEEAVAPAALPGTADTGGAAGQAASAAHEAAASANGAAGQ
ncbi:hypothetical protein HXX76_001684 [Chlamydomonas incerta]|uniref:PPM-type phosphatase domain-containing protein n=1 Tax=Chlamydomonas incerta TaxID=51695 RepID=A0A835WCM2_CHLIN|nr:hypothetical protein HXX76_001684 [Chlamydomonas incerta]|eukprot:KAG2444948.1 hypothetical protein HXX76_001684 [Chlamydomonas incerta]